MIPSLVHRYYDGTVSAYSPRELVQIRKDLRAEVERLERRVEKMKNCWNCGVWDETKGYCGADCKDHSHWQPQAEEE